MSDLPWVKDGRFRGGVERAIELLGGDGDPEVLAQLWLALRALGGGR